MFSFEKAFLMCFGSSVHIKTVENAYNNLNPLSRAPLKVENAVSHACCVHEGCNFSTVNVYERFSVDGEKTAKTVTYRRERLDVFSSRKMHYSKKRKFTFGWIRQMWLNIFGKLMKA